MDKFDTRITISPRNNYFLEFGDASCDDFMMCHIKDNKLYLIVDGDNDYPSEGLEISLEQFVEAIRDRKHNEKN